MKHRTHNENAVPLPNKCWCGSYYKDVPLFRRQTNGKMEQVGILQECIGCKRLSRQEEMHQMLEGKIAEYLNNNSRLEDILLRTTRKALEDMNVKALIRQILVENLAQDRELISRIFIESIAKGRNSSEDI